MRKQLRKIRKSVIAKEEVIADLIFLLISAFISFLITFLFDIHHSFYEWPIKLRFVFNTYYPYIFFIPIGTIIIFVIIKIFLCGVEEEEKLK